MKHVLLGLAAALPLMLSQPPDAGAQEKSVTPREALRPFNHVIGRWKGTGITKGTREDGQAAFWTEHMDWTWRFKGDDAWLEVDFSLSKNFTSGELRYLPDRKLFQFTVKTPDKKELVFQGKLDDKRLELFRDDPAKKEKQQLAIRLLHNNRFLYSFAVLPQGRTIYKQIYQVGATKEGEAFASSGGPECIVSGGLGTMAVTHDGKTYYVC